MWSKLRPLRMLPTAWNIPSQPRPLTPTYSCKRLSTSRRSQAYLGKWGHPRLSRNLPPYNHPHESYSHLVQTSNSSWSGLAGHESALVLRQCQQKHRFHREPPRAVLEARLSQNQVAQNQLLWARASRATRKMGRWRARSDNNLNCSAKWIIVRQQVPLPTE